jgi:hypothetical protein
VGGEGEGGWIWYFIHLYEDRMMKPIKIVLSRWEEDEGERWSGWIWPRHNISIYENMTTKPPVQQIHASKSVFIVLIWGQDRCKFPREGSVQCDRQSHGLRFCEPLSPGQHTCACAHTRLWLPSASLLCFWLRWGTKPIYDHSFSFRCQQHRTRFSVCVKGEQNH